ncbi:MAG: VWA domain-containing protein [Acidobacteriota bacterium]|nr:VWA domain-containing protein [Acidobacteriota bacterium]MDH3528826.1 VWA domain-containing protein [Acidobacteriota bacterium]
MRLFSPAPILLILSAALAALSQTPTPTPIESDEVVKISTTLIQIDATFTDKKGNPVRDISRDEVEIFENGKKQEITNFSFVFAQSDRRPETEPDDLQVPTRPRPLAPGQVRRTIALVVDDLTLSFESTYYVRRALRDFVDNQMQEGDLVAIIRTAGGIGALQQFTSDKRQLYSAIEKVRWSFLGNGGIGAFAPVESRYIDPRAEELKEKIDETRQEVNDLRESIFATGTLGAINYIVRGMRDLPGRKSVMVMSDGFRIFRQNSRGFGESTRAFASMKQLIVQANRASVVIYTMDARGLVVDGFMAPDGVEDLSVFDIEEEIADRRQRLFDTQAGLIYLARETGGLSIVNNNDLRTGIRRMLNDQSYYLIGYQPQEEVFDPEKRRFNKLEIKVKRKGVNVRYRSGFFGVSDEQFDAQPLSRTDSGRILDALTSPFAVNDLTLSLNTIFKSEVDDKYVAISFLHIDIKNLEFETAPDGNKKAAFELVAINFGENGKPADELGKTFVLNIAPEKFQSFLDEGVVYAFNFPVKKAGAYQMRVAIRDHASNKVGSASQFLEVPKLKKNRITLSGLILDNVSYREWNESQVDGGIRIRETESPESIGLVYSADTALRRFKAGTVLKYGFEVYNAASKSGGRPELEMRTRFYSNGKVTYEGKDNPITLAPGTNGRIIPIMGALNLGSKLTPGDYALQVIITDKLAKKNNRVASQFVYFEIVE